MATLTLLCQFNGGCMGCCGHNFISKRKIEEAVEKNTLEFNESSPKTEQELLKFRDRKRSMDLRNGVCRNLIKKEGQMFCPLHPARNENKELREGHCDLNHLCRTAKEFECWDWTKQKKFLNFIEGKKLDNLDYSMKIDNGSLLKEFISL